MLQKDPQFISSSPGISDGSALHVVLNEFQEVVDMLLLQCKPEGSRPREWAPASDRQGQPSPRPGSPLRTESVCNASKSLGKYLGRYLSTEDSAIASLNPVAFGPFVRPTQRMLGGCS
ncbi:hypothetical protein TWF225_012094 [Orbilia oligospora]|uniref:Uncharacterized protein n=1 Tax=Orbilia oligospora TaxID=2813651 RepID=A0A7C8P8F3_ORBOL|nr:hypothetical protein TWF751_012135 [Orbilia oligospora]KAF3182546.1 hypothetical protein TWF225_012094 [Orbilia oligospora]KAF3256307.1 hypothetical protein TWF128_012091 [Orbilia oligospora]KAF3261864.1 hypothetical protein TWF217_012080 [Orbilia oligospora]KAF3298435.1 hypothetical protein TWF132_012083 [Orbilia oligospora]